MHFFTFCPCLLLFLAIPLSGGGAPTSHLTAFITAAPKTARREMTLAATPSETSVWKATAAAALTTIALSTSAPASADADLTKGAQLFQANCAGCHAGGMNFVAEKKTLKKEALEKYRSLDQAKLQKFVQTGMPHKFLPLKFEEEKDYFDVTSYVLDQAVNDKW